MQIHIRNVLSCNTWFVQALQKTKQHCIFNQAFRLTEFQTALLVAAIDYNQ